jgi:hypothetical protein
MEGNEGLTGLARLSGLLVHEHDPVGVITAGLLEACRCVSADAGGVLVRSTNDQLDVLAATSHRAADLEAYQAASENGPCVESMHAQQVVSVDNSTEADERWPGFGDRMRTAGYERCFAVPMRWRGVGIGGLNLFWKEAGHEAVDELLLQTFADVLTLAALHVRPLTTDDATERLQDALEARGGLEQAKGVLAWQRDLDMSEAYAALLRIAEEHDLTLGEAADAVVDGAMRGESL